MSDRFDTLLGKMREALFERYGPTPTEQQAIDLRAVLRLALAELPLIRDQYEREIAELKAEIKNLQEWIDGNELRINQLEEEITKFVEQGE